MKAAPSPLPVGKLPIRALERLLKRNRLHDRRVIVGPGIGEDAAIIDAGGPRYLVAKTDPITFTADRIGWYAVQINANDIAAMGAKPLWFLAALLLPEKRTTEGLARKIFQDISNACKGIGISLIGGHTEITYGLNRPLVVGQMLGEVDKNKLVRTSGAKPGDAIILTKGVAIEGSAIIAREHADEMTHILGAQALARCRNFIYRPGLSVVKEALIAAERGFAHAMHDPTEGGLATALHEVARAAGVGLLIRAEAVPVFRETQAICSHYRLDPLGLIASGALLVMVSQKSAQEVLARIRSARIAATIIGEVRNRRDGVKLLSAEGLRDLPLYEQDELMKI